MASSKNKISGNVIKIVSNLTNTQSFGIYNKSRHSDISTNNIYVDNPTPGLQNYGIWSETTAIRCSIIGNQIDMENNNADDRGWWVDGADCTVGGNITIDVGSNSATASSTQFGNRDF